VIAVFKILDNYLCVKTNCYFVISLKRLMFVMAEEKAANTIKKNHTPQGFGYLICNKKKILGSGLVWL
jgi:hypothetical protein